MAKKRKHGTNVVRNITSAQEQKRLEKRIKRLFSEQSIPVSRQNEFFDTLKRLPERERKKALKAKLQELKLESEKLERQQQSSAEGTSDFAAAASMPRAGSVMVRAFKIMAAAISRRRGEKTFHQKGLGRFRYATAAVVGGFALAALLILTPAKHAGLGARTETQPDSKKIEEKTNPQPLSVAEAEKNMIPPVAEQKNSKEVETKKTPVKKHVRSSRSHEKDYSVSKRAMPEGRLVPELMDQALTKGQKLSVKATLANLNDRDKARLFNLASAVDAAQTKKDRREKVQAYLKDAAKTLSRAGAIFAAADLAQILININEATGKENTLGNAKMLLIVAEAKRALGENDEAEYFSRKAVSSAIFDHNSSRDDVRKIIKVASKNGIDSGAQRTRLPSYRPR